jgi:Uma2 family endonuclease
MMEPAIQLPHRRWTRAEYERAGQLGLFRPDERLELIDGEIVEKMTPQNTPHSVGIRLCELALREPFRVGHDVRCQLPLGLGDDSEPEPDIAVVVGAPRDYLDAHPATAVLVIEVADTSLSIDRSVKSHLYARAGIPEYWILNLTDRTLEVHRQPGPMAEQPLGHSYQFLQCLDVSQSVCPLAAAGCSISVADLLP